MTDKYESPLTTRYASEYMLELFSDDTRYQTWRRLWASLAEAERTLGLPITREQVMELNAHITDIDYALVEEKEKEFRHDVLAHVYAFGKAAPSAAGIIHLGASSSYVKDNADLIIYRNALRYIHGEVVSVIKHLAKFADTYKSLPTLGYTHYQPAQLVTVGKRASLWLQDFSADIQELDFVIGSMRFLGCRGTVGTDASFMDLFDGDFLKVEELNNRLASDFGFNKCFDVSGQTYPRKLDSRILNVLSALAQSSFRMATDIRLLQHDWQVEEAFGDGQIGSSSMPYKRNPMRCERICSLSRYLMADAINAPLTASSQWFERTLDDSANRRLSMPEAFLCADSVLRLVQNVIEGLQVNERIIEKSVKRYMPFIATENIVLESVRKGGNLQEIKAIVRKCSMQATAQMKEGGECDLLERLAAEPKIGLTLEEMQQFLDPAMYIGRSAHQVSVFIKRLRLVLKETEITDSDIEL